MDNLCFFCSKTEVFIESFDLESLRLLQGTEGICEDHKTKCLIHITRLDEANKAAAPKKYELKTGQGAYKPSPAVKKGFMDLTTEREPGCDDD